MCHLLHPSSTPLVKVFLAMLGHTTRHSIFLVSSAPYFLLNRSISTLRTCSIVDRSLQHDERQIRVPNTRPYVSYSNTIGTLHLLDEGNGSNILPNLLSAFFPVDLNNERRV